MIDEAADFLLRRGLRHFFGVLGGGVTLELASRLKSGGATYIPSHFEGSAAIMAGTWGRIKNSPGICLCIKGPGVANLIPGLALANFEQLPLIAFAEAYDSLSSLAQAHKRMNQIGLAQAVVKQLLPLGDAQATLEHAWSTAISETPGPVLVELTKDAGGRKPLKSPLSDGEMLDTESIHLLERAKRPILILGTLASRLSLENKLSKLEIPVFSTVSAKGVFDETSPYSGGIFTGAGLAATPEAQILTDADLVIGIGLRNEELLKTLPFNCSLINFDIPSQNKHVGLNCQRVFPPTELEKVFELVRQKTWGLDELSEAHRSLSKAMTSPNFLPIDVFNAIDRRFGENIHLVVDTGLYCVVAEHVYKARSVNQFLSAGNSRYMGVALPMAIGCALADSTTPTVLVSGDGGIGMFVSESQIAVEFNLPVIFLLLSDGGYGSIRASAKRKNIIDDLTAISNPSWARTFESFGIPSTAAPTSEALQEILATWNPKSGPLFIESSFDPEQYQDMVLPLRN